MAHQHDINTNFAHLISKSFISDFYLASERGSPYLLNFFIVIIIIIIIIVTIINIFIITAAEFSQPL